MTAELYVRLEKHLQASEYPLTCNELVDKADIREITSDPNRVSDALGNLFRRGYLDRHAAPKVLGSQAKWAYLWKKPKRRTLAMTPGELAAMHTAAEDARPRAEVETKVILQQPSIMITESNDFIYIETETLSIRIESKK